MSEPLSPIFKNAFSQSIGVLRRSTRTNRQQSGEHEQCPVHIRAETRRSVARHLIVSIAI